MSDKLKNGDYESLIKNLNNKAEKELKDATSVSLEEHLKHASNLEEAVLDENQDHQHDGLHTDLQSKTGTTSQEADGTHKATRLVFQFLIAVPILLFALIAFFVTITDGDEDLVLIAFFFMFIAIALISRSLKHKS